MPFNIAAFTYIGTQRPTQQDAMLVNEILLTEGKIELTNQLEIKCFVADGVGGSADGAFASQFVLDKIRETSFVEYWKFVEQLREINKYLISQNNEGKGNTATTLSGVIFRDESFHFFHAGDSEIYLLRAERVLPLSVSQCKQVDEQFKSANPGYSLEQLHEKARNTITSYLGGYSPQLRLDADWKRKIELPQIKGVQPGDVILICSDGLFKSVSQTDIKKKLYRENKSIFETSDELRTLSEKHGAEDNVSMILIEFFE